MLEHSAHAPAAYPNIVRATAPLRAAASAAGDADSINLWAGQAYALCQERSAAELVADFSQEARASLQRVSHALMK
ncbi:MAG TPA: nitronate monooxygenase, partial [Polyangiales bacterium]|nr:nitronate monooxygenase [Polyangiales bacterium]